MERLKEERDKLGEALREQEEALKDALTKRETTEAFHNKQKAEIDIVLSKMVDEEKELNKKIVNAEKVARQVDRDIIKAKGEQQAGNMTFCIASIFRFIVTGDEESSSAYSLSSFLSTPFGTFRDGTDNLQNEYVNAISIIFVIY